ncbi:MAG TPA: hypothetical protein VF490_22420, partial [Chryseosolibacter sp.]
LPPGEDNEWVVYEGRVPLGEKTFLYQELFMLPGNLAGEGRYRMSEYIEENDASTQVSSFAGNYATIYGKGPEERLVALYNSAHREGFKRTYLGNSPLGDRLTATHIRMIREERFRKTDLALRIQGRDRLVVLDQRLEPLTLEPEYNLVKRTSRLFTVEGYFSHRGDTSDFFEMNTKERWPVSKGGSYSQAIRQYHQLTTEKSEVTYLKAIGFSIRQPNRAGKESDVLVLKKVLEMASVPSVTGNDNRATP